MPRPYRSVEAVAQAMRRLMGAGLAKLPLPGAGNTLERWQALAAAGEIDLSLAKIYEGHTDALAILAELGGGSAEGLWAVWAAEAPGHRLVLTGDGILTGRKAWCSGAAAVDFALVTAWTEADEPVFARVNLRQARVTIMNGGWEAVGMAASQSVPVVFEGARAQAVGAPGDYVARPGFWQGGAGIAAVWYGAAVAIAEKMRHSRRIESDPHAAAHLGAVDVVLRAARALLVESAGWIDAHPRADASTVALRARACVEAAANEVLLRTGRALGPGPLCTDAVHAQRCADLPVFLRQSHAESDLAALGQAMVRESIAWKF